MLLEFQLCKKSNKDGLWLGGGDGRGGGCPYEGVNTFALGFNLNSNITI
tara:strand:- start:799 stop:945 length:147 start_codon:yes stop_codon:yes gene_type:complete